jgi:hypothetical protein
MALTFEEIESYAGNPALEYVITATLVITQEDGRTSYCLFSGQNSTFDPNAAKISADESNILPTAFPQYFSDRVGPQGGNNVPDVFAAIATDPLRFSFQRVAANIYKLFLHSPRWGKFSQVAITQTNNAAKVYSGWGEQIGNGPQLALYAFSFQNVFAIV